MLGDGRDSSTHSADDLLEVVQVNQKEYSVKRQGESEWERTISAFTSRKAAIAFIEQAEGVSNKDSIVVLELNNETSEEALFKVSKLLRKESEEKVHVVAVEQEEVTGYVKPVKGLAPKIDKIELRVQSSYGNLRSCITLLAAVGYIVAALTIITGLNVSIALESGAAILLSIFNGALAVIGVYVAQALLQAFVDIADVMLSRSDKS